MEQEQAAQRFVKRMTATYPAPTHLRSNAEAVQQTLKTYIDALRRFSPTVLEHAWQKAAEENEFWT